MIKKKYYIRQELPATQVWEYEVEAESEEKARELVENGDVDAYNYVVEDDSPNGMSSEPEIVEVYELE